MAQTDILPAMRASRLVDRSRLRRIAFWLTGLVAFVAIAGFLVAPPIVRSQAEKILARELGRTTTIDKVAINPFAPSVTITGLNVSEQDGTQPFVTFDELYVRASYTSLFRFAPVIDAVRLSRPHARIVRTAADRFNFSDIRDKLAAAPKREEPSKPARFAVYNIEVIDGQVDVDDRVVDRKHELADIDLGLPFISSLESQRDVFVEPRFSVKANGAAIGAKAKSKPFAEARESIVNFALRDFDVTPLVVYSPAQLPVNLTSARLDVDLDITFAQPPGKAPTIVIAGRTELKSVAADFPTGGPLLRVASVTTELAAVEPLAGRYEVTKVRAASPEIWVRRDKGGEFALARLFRAPAPAPAPATAPPPAPEQARPLTYRLDEISVDGALVHWLDERGSRPIELELRDLRAAVRGVSSASGSRLTFEAAGLTDLQESLALDGEATLQPITAAGKVRIEKLSLPRLWPLAESFLAAELTAGRLDAGTRFNYHSADTAPHLVLEGIEVTATDIAMRQPRAKREFLRLATFELRDGAFDLVARRVALGAVASKGLRLNAVRERDGSIDLAQLVPPAASKPADAPAGAAPDKPFLVELKKAAIDNYAIRVEDRTLADPFTWSLEPLAATVDNFSSAPGAKANASVKAVVNRKGTLTAAGPFGVNPPTARLRVEARALDIAPVQRFIDDKVNVTVTSGLLSTRGNLRVDAAPGRPLRGGYTGELNLADFATVDKSSQLDLLKWKSLFVGGIDVDLEPLKVGIGEVALADFYSRLIVNADGTLNLQNIRVREGQAAVSTTAPTTAAGATPKPAADAASAAPAKAAVDGPVPDRGLPANLRIGKITLQGGNVNFSDFFIKPNYSANLTGIGGSVTEMTAETAADLELRGKVDNTAPVEIAGRLNPLAKDLFLDIKASARDIELPPLTPYSVKYAGYGIEKGKLSVTVKYFIENRKLAAENNVYLDQLTFGEKVESTTATKLPVLLAVALLKDRNGVIDIDLPISGSIDDPQFSVGGLIVRVIVNLLTKIITAPFTALASAFGGNVELSYVEFAAGSAGLDDESRKRLDTLAKALNGRPALKIEVMGRADAAGDREGLKHAHVEARVKAEKMKQLTRDGRAPASIDDVSVGKEEYPALLKAAYGEEKFPKPRNVIGLAKDLPVPEMENLMLANAQVTEEDLRQLANRRAQAAKGYLVETGKVSAERVFLVAPKSAGEESKDKGRPTRAEFVLK